MTSHTDTPDVEDGERLAAVLRSGLLRGVGRDHLNHLVAAAREATGVRTAMVSIVGAQRQHFVAASGLAEPWASRGYSPMSHSICKDVVAGRSAVVLDDLAGEAQYADHLARSEMDVQAYCGVPIRDPDGYVLGSFCALHDDANAWTPATTTILQHLANAVTETIAANQGYATMLADLQDRLLPDDLPQPEGGVLQGRYRAVLYSEAVGGDFFDARRRRNGAVDLVIGDVVGHGVASTQAAAQLRSATRVALQGDEPSPADVLNRVAEVCGDLPGCASSALLVARVAADGRHVTWARAGAMPPVLTGPGARVLDEGANPPLGVGPATDHPACQVTLEPGQGLLLYTDGVVERRGRHLADGFADLAKATSSAASIDEILADTCPVDEQADDVAVLWYRHVSPGAPDTVG